MAILNQRCFAPVIRGGAIHSAREMLKGQRLLSYVLLMLFVFQCFDGLVVATVFVPDTLWEPIHIFPPYYGMCAASPLLLKLPLVLNAEQGQWGCFLPADDKGKGGCSQISPSVPSLDKRPK